MSFSSSLEPYAAGAAIGAFRAAVGTPLDGVATREITRNISPVRAVAQLWNEGMFFKGFVPNAVKLAFKTPVQIITTTAASHLYVAAVPQSVRQNHPAFRGTFIGIFASVFETILWANPLTSLRTRLMTSEKRPPAPPWPTKNSPAFFFEHLNFHFFSKGLDAALVHRASSGVIFFTTYEKLKSLYPDHPFLVSTASGMTQVIATSPAYCSMIHQQKTQAVTKNIFTTLAYIHETQGVMGLYRGLTPRLVHSFAVSHLVMYMLESAGAINRK